MRTRLFRFCSKLRRMVARFYLMHRIRYTVKPPQDSTMSLTSVVSLVLIVVGPEFIREAEHFSLVHGGSANDRNFKMSHSIRPTKNDRILTDDSRLVIEPHVRYIQSLNTRKDELEYWLTEHLRLNGLYWGLTALHLLRSPDALPRQETIDFVFACQTESGGFAAAPKHDPHILYTCSAIQILATVDALDEIEKRCQGGKLKIGKWIANLQNKQTGTWAGDEWGEEDTRFLYTAFNALSLLKLLQLADIDKAVEYIISCANFDGGYGTSPGAESHSGQIFACLGALSISKRLETVDKDKLGGWLSERQVECGGLNGRPEKLEDVCYSWWVGCSLTMIDRFHWIDGDKLASFILRCQDAEFGGFADRPGDVVDVFHTLFGLAGLSLLGYPGLDEVNPIYCMPQKIVERVLGPQAEMEM